MSRLRGLVAAIALAVTLSSCSTQAADEPEVLPAAAGSEHGELHSEVEHAEGEHPAAEHPEGHTGAEGGSHHGGPPGSVELWAVQTAPLGVVVTDATGRIVFRSDRDTNQPPTTTCVDACTAAWTPVLTGQGPVVPLGVEEDKLGTVARPDGTQQITLGGWPLYVKAGAPGPTQGADAQGADGVWFAIAPDGEKAA